MPKLDKLSWQTQIGLYTFIIPELVEVAIAHAFLFTVDIFEGICPQQTLGLPL